jgi:hypothetical protein
MTVTDTIAGATAPTTSTAPLEHDLGPGGDVTIETLDTEIRLRGIAGSVARVRLAAGDLADEFQVETGPGRLAIRPIRRWSFGRRRDVGPLEIEVPADAAVRASSASGSVLALDLAAGGRFRSASGDIDLAGLAGTVDAESMSGGIRVRASGPTSLRVRTVSGRVDVVAPAATRIEAKSVSGNVDVSGRLTGEGPFALESVSGDLTIATDGAIRLMASTLSGRVRSELPNIVDVGRGRTLTLGGDGPVVSARCVSGNIRVVPVVSGVEPIGAAAPAPAAVPPAPTGAAPVSRERPATPSAVGPEASAAPSAPPSAADPRMTILRALERGDIDVAEAGRRLQTLETDHA